jgi:hypothetical protein
MVQLSVYIMSHHTGICWSHGKYKRLCLVETVLVTQKDSPESGGKYDKIWNILYLFRNVSLQETNILSKFTFSGLKIWIVKGSLI